MIKLTCGVALVFFTLLQSAPPTPAAPPATRPVTQPSPPDAMTPDTLPRFADRVVTFDHPDGAYAPDLLVADFGNGAPGKGRDFVTVRDGHAVVTYKAGKKVSDTGLSAHARIPDAQQVTLEYRIRYPLDFEPGLHGKQIGLSGGKGYDGGRGEEARNNGDGWSVRLQFDAPPLPPLPTLPSPSATGPSATQSATTALPGDVTNQLYTYHCRMPAKYGDALGTKELRFPLVRGRWHAIKLRVTMQSAPDAADGRIEVFQDGRPRFDVKGVQFVTKEEGRNINRVRFEMFPGGGGIFPTKDHDIEVDDLRWTSSVPTR